MMNTFQRVSATIFGRLQIPLSSKFHSRHATSKVPQFLLGTDVHDAPSPQPACSR